ncbi:putative protein with domain at the C-termini of GCD6, eIF-2B epsilon, eIF-4 gamma and eIF-5 [Lyophyllum shimeji]|uniref:W2 domain-containing protein n=1 Tax=Lyophyllum shimeji TaxID=47721 RepID=A0A9P3UPE8_LYOSH|nr:putative protein with domain at the C-termini of GCD6, eIF-2B epsilon, eIF-4 gamma and eIF-5 [Lyophyllum shimeji]
MAAQLPTEVWLLVARFVDEEVLRDLLGVNRLFLDLAMDIRYSKIEFDDMTLKASKTISRLSDPTIARRVRRLDLQLNQLARRKPVERGVPGRVSPRGFMQRLTTALLHLHPSLPSLLASAKSDSSKSPRTISFEDLTAVLPAMVNVEEFSIDSWNLPTQFDLRPFFSAAWLGFGTKIRKLSLGGNIEGFKVLLASKPVLSALEELHFEFTDNMNPPRPNSTEGLHIDTTTRTLLRDFVAPFINDLGAQLRVLKLCSWASIDLSSFFKQLGPFPRLQTLKVWAAFDRSFANDPSGLTQVLYGAAPTLKHLMLRLNPSGLFVHPEADLALCNWLAETVNNNDQLATGLRSLELYPSAGVAGLDCLIVLIRRSAATLERLNVKDRYLLLPEITRISAPFSSYTRLRYLRLNVRKLPVELFDLLAPSFPNLHSLVLRAADGEPAEDFTTQVQTRRYEEWKLYDIEIWQGGNELEHETMLLLKECIPMAKVVNIRRDVDDKFYRYRMPLLETKIEGKGNGIKTVVPNMSDVARALSRPPTYPTKFFGCELGAQTSFDEKNDRYIVNGAHNAERLRELLDVFIDKFVLCRACKNPETDLVILKNGRNEDIIRDCKACGERTGVDMRHKLTTFILKNPPVQTKKGKKKNAGNAAAGVGGGGGGAENGDAAAQEANGAESDDELTKKIKAEAAELNQDAALAKEDWSADTSPEAVKQRIKALEGSMAAVVIAGDDEGSDDDANSPYAHLGKWIEDNREMQTDPKAHAVAIYKKAEELGIEKKHKTILVLVQALFTETVVAEIPKYAPLLAKMVTSEKHQKSLLGGIERFVGIAHPDLIPAVPKILMELYQIDVLEEEVVTQWGTHVSKKYVDKETSKRVRKASEPFLKWLEEAEDDDDDE